MASGVFTTTMINGQPVLPEMAKLHHGSDKNGVPQAGGWWRRPDLGAESG